MVAWLVIIGLTARNSEDYYFPRAKPKLLKDCLSKTRSVVCLNNKVTWRNSERFAVRECSRSRAWREYQLTVENSLQIKQRFSEKVCETVIFGG